MASNGYLNVNTLTRVPLTAGGFGYLENSTAQGWFAARADLIKTTGITPVIIEDGLYRDYARQVYWKTYWTRLGKPQNAATPGTSNHGLALCVDVNNISAYNQNVLDTVMARHGFVRDTSETWHYHHTSTNPADSGSTPIESEEMTPEDRALLITQLLNTAAYDGGPSISQVLKNLNTWTKPILDAVFSGGTSMPDAGKSIGTSLAQIHTAVNSITIASGQFTPTDRAMLDDIANKAELSSALTNTVNLVNSHADANKAQIIQEIDTHGGSSLSAFTATITPVE